MISRQMRQSSATWPALLAGIILAAVLIAGAGYAACIVQQQKINDLNKQITSLKSQLGDKNQPASPAKPNYTVTSKKGVHITVYYPTANAKVASPVAVIGEIPGNWSFEASFPVKLLDSSGAAIASGQGKVLGNWMTDLSVPFSVQLTYTGSPNGGGTLVLQKDNPSGLAANDDSVEIPVRF